jgi:chaperonin GroES
MSKFALLHDLVLIKKKPAAEKTESGIHLMPANTGAKGAPMEGIVVAVGPGKYTAKGDFVKPDVEPGDQIIFAQTDLKEIKALGDGFVIVPSGEVLLRLRPENPVIPDGPVFNLS